MASVVFVNKYSVIIFIYEILQNSTKVLNTGFILLYNQQSSLNMMSWKKKEQREWVFPRGVDLFL